MKRKCGNTYEAGYRGTIRHYCSNTCFADACDPKKPEKNGCGREFHSPRIDGEPKPKPRKERH